MKKDPQQGPYFREIPKSLSSESYGVCVCRVRTCEGVFVNGKAMLLALFLWLMTLFSQKP